MIPDWPSPEEAEEGIFFSTHEIDFTLQDEEQVSTWIQSVILAEGHSLQRVDFVFCDDDFLLDINRTHLDHDYYTDIITFPLNDEPLLAEIYISIDRVRDNATFLGISFEDELHRVIIHGILHLCGYEDHEEDDIREIRAREEFYLQKISDDMQ